MATNIIGTDSSLPFIESNGENPSVSLPKIDKALEILVQYNMITGEISQALESLKKSKLKVLNSSQTQSAFMSALFETTSSKNSSEKIDLKNRKSDELQSAESTRKTPLFSSFLHIGRKIQTLYRGLSPRLISLLARIVPNRKNCLTSFQKDREDQISEIKKDLRVLKDFFSEEERFRPILKQCREAIDTLNALKYMSLGSNTEATPGIEQDRKQLIEIQTELTAAIKFYSELNIKDLGL